MKKAILTVALLGTFFISNASSYNPLTLRQQIEKAVQFEPGILQLEAGETQFVRVAFAVTEDGHLHIKDTNFSNAKLKKALVQKLNSVELAGSFKPGETYYYNFTFRKM